MGRVDRGASSAASLLTFLALAGILTHRVSVAIVSGAAPPTAVDPAVMALLPSASAEGRATRVPQDLPKATRGYVTVLMARRRRMVKIHQLAHQCHRRYDAVAWNPSESCWGRARR